MDEPVSHFAIDKHGEVPPRLQLDFIRLKQNSAIDPGTVEAAGEVVQLFSMSHSSNAHLGVDEDGCCLEWPRLGLFCHFEAPDEGDGNSKQVKIWVHHCPVAYLPPKFYYPKTPMAAATTLKTILDQK